MWVDEAHGAVAPDRPQASYVAGFHTSQRLCKELMSRTWPHASPKVSAPAARR